MRRATDLLLAWLPCAALLLGTALWMGAALVGCQKTNEFRPPPPPAVTVATPVEREVVDWFETTGTTRAVKTVELRARVNGYLQAIGFKDGQLVAEGTPLFTIEKAPYEATLASATAELAKAQAQLKLTTATLGRTNALVERKAATKEQLDVAEAERAGAAAEVAARQAAIRQAELDLSYTEIRAPFAGRIGAHQVDVGNLVQSGSTLLATLEAVDPIYAVFNLSEADLLRFLRMQEAGTLKISEVDPPEIELAFGETNDFAFKGKLEFREFGVDPTTGTTVRRAVYANPDQRLIPGLFVKLRAAVGEPKPRLLVEERAIGADQRGEYLLVVNDKNVVEQRPVTLGPTDGGLRVILSGIQPQDRVVVNGLQRARPGAEVRPEVEGEAVKSEGGSAAEGDGGSGEAGDRESGNPSPAQEASPADAAPKSAASESAAPVEPAPVEPAPE